MNSLIRKSATPFGALIVAIFFLIIAAVFSVSGITHATSSDADQRGRLITIHDRGIETVVLSQGITIGDALTEAKITLDSKDVVEPAITEKMVASDYQVNIYRARPVIIVDGSVRRKVMTPYQTASQIASSVDITLYTEDKTSIDRVDNLAEGAGLQMTITRAVPFSFTLYGNTTVARTQGKTIGEMLAEKNITIGKDDRVMPSEDTPLTNGMTVRVWREGKQTITVEEPIAFESEKIKDANQEIGYSAIKSIGENGSRNVTYEIIVQDGKEVTRTEIASLIIKNSVKQVEIIGAKPKTFGGSCSEWMSTAGITDTASASALISRESNCNPYSVNKTSGACGIGQALPCSKTGCEMGNGYCQMSWMNDYVLGRYGSWAAALQHSYTYGWY